VPTSTFFGRARELEKLDALFANNEHIVTLFGAAGAGKTRLALRYAELRSSKYEPHGGAWFCDLTDAREESTLYAAVAEALGISSARRGASPAMRDALSGAIAARGCALVVLDNCEQIVDAVASAVTAWHRAAPETRFVATSRERLRIEGESVLEVPPLGLPDSDDVAGAESVQLFVDRARRVRAGYELSGSEAPAVAEIVRRLDGLPLAIELAAARAGVMGARTLLERLTRPLDVLTHGHRDASQRQRTMRGAIEWSWALLDGAERLALAQASVFRGGFSVEAAERVLDLSSVGGAPSVVEVVESLRDKSLLRAYESSETPGEMRLGMYVSIREFASEQLAQDPESTAETQRRHTEYFLAIADEWMDARSLHARVEFENLAAVHARV
jgi:predicted ATPase